jgi:hypothetical protein
MGAEFLEVVCDDNCICGSGEYCGDNGAHLGRISVFSHEASGGKYALREVICDLEPGVIDAVSASPLSEFFRPDSLVNHSAGAGSNLAKARYKKAESEC